MLVVIERRFVGGIIVSGGRLVMKAGELQKVKQKNGLLG